MSKAQELRENFESLVKEAQAKKGPVAVFGAGRGAWYVLKALERYGVEVAAFIDNDKAKQGTFLDRSVLAPEDALKIYGKIPVVVGVFRPKTARAIIIGLRELGFEDVRFLEQEALFIYLVDVAGRRCDEETLARSISVLFENYEEEPDHYGFTSKGWFVSTFASVIITQKCSLRCKDCGQFIPYYKKPVHFTVEKIVEDIRRYAQAFDVVPEISLPGGEPFLHPELVEICERTSAISNIVFISINTNGTLLPTVSDMASIAKCGVDVHQSDYGSLSRRQKELFLMCEKHGIYCDILFVNPSKKWTRPAPIFKRGRDDAGNDALYRRCVKTKICCQIMDGELHRCAFSLHPSRQGAIPVFEGDFVRLDDPSASDAMIKARIRDFFRRGEHLEACDYCDRFNLEEVPPALQLDGNDGEDENNPRPSK